MRTLRHRIALVTAIVGMAASGRMQQPPSTTVVPAAFSNQEAPGVAFWALSPFAARHQLLIGPTHLAGASHQTLQALEVRRNIGDNRPLAAGQLVLRITLSHSPRPADDPSESFEENRGADEVTVFSGIVALPASQGSPTAPAPWLSPYSVLIPFRKPFPYAGGTLCIETETTLLPGRNPTPWWPIDAVVQRGGGSTTAFGSSCATGSAGADPSSLVPGSTAVLYFRGALADGSLGLCMVGAAGGGIGMSSLPLDLTPLGAPGCWLHIAPVVSAPSVARTLGGTSMALANWRLHLPTSPFLIGSTLDSQWLWMDATANPLGLTLSEGLQITLGAPPALTDVGWVESPDPSATTGDVLRGRMPVIRLQM